MLWNRLNAEKLAIVGNDLTADISIIFQGIGIGLLKCSYFQLFLLIDDHFALNSSHCLCFDYQCGYCCLFVSVSINILIVGIV